MTNRTPFMLLLVAAAGLLTLGCTGRAHLAPNTGMAYERIFQAQVTSRPARPIAAMSADDAKLVLQSHRATLGGQQGGAGVTSFQLGAGMAGGGAGLLTPATGNLGGGEE